jgi:hypothetical protein
MAQTAEQTRALIDAIAGADSLDILSDLRRQVRLECGPAARGSFVELLIDVRQAKLAPMGTDTSRARPS